MEKLALHTSRTIAKAVKDREAKIRSTGDQQLGRKTYDQMRNIHTHLRQKSKISNDPNLFWKRKAADPSVGYVRHFAPKSLPKHKKFLRYVASLL